MSCIFLCSLMALLPDFEVLKCSPALVLKCLADVAMYVTFTSREQINYKRPLSLRLEEFDFSKRNILALLTFYRRLKFSVKPFRYK